MPQPVLEYVPGQGLADTKVAYVSEALNARVTPTNAELGPTGRLERFEAPEQSHQPSIPLRMRLLQNERFTTNTHEPRT